MLDATHAPGRKSWVTSANGHTDFPIQNLPLGVFSPSGAVPRGGVAIGDEILDLSLALGAGVFSGLARQAAEAAGENLNRLLALGAAARVALRAQLGDLLDAGAKARPELLHRAVDCVLHLPARIGGYTDFYTGINHARNVGALFRPESPLLPNYKYVPIGYHGRASSIRASGAAFHRPCGQRKGDDPTPLFGPSTRMDFELELGVWVGAGNALGEPIPAARAADHIAGFCLLNDWSARDFQAWEYQPLGPFLAKNFATTISPWIITPEALAPFRVPQPARPEGDPVPLAYLLDDQDQAAGAIDLRLEVWISTALMRERRLPPQILSASNALHMYWTAAQMVAHHASGGCNLEPGDLLGSGTISGPNKSEVGSLLELTNGGREPIFLPSGERRTFLEDGDEIGLRARAVRDGAVAIGFGECRALLLPARSGV